MTYEELLERLEYASKHMDTEGGHIEADGAVADFLRELGYTEAADIFDTMDKWFA